MVLSCLPHYFSLQRSYGSLLSVSLFVMAKELRFIVVSLFIFRDKGVTVHCCEFVYFS